MADLQFCLVAIDHWATCMTKAEWSGWTQAVGSVGALLGIWWTVRMQRRLAVESERRHNSAAVAAALNGSRNAVASVAAVLEVIAERPDSDALVLRLQGVRLRQGLLLAESVKLEYLPIRHQGAVLALRHMAIMLIDAIAIQVEENGANADKSHSLFRGIVVDQVSKIATLEEVLKEPVS